MENEGSPSEVGYHTYWNKRANRLVGKRIVSASYMTEEMAKDMGLDWWDYSTVVLLMDDGTIVFASSDDEMNQCGTLFAYEVNGTEIPMPRIPLKE